MNTIERIGGTGTCFTNNRSQQKSIVENAKAGETSLQELTMADVGRLMEDVRTTM